VIAIRRNASPDIRLAESTPISRLVHSRSAGHRTEHGARGALKFAGFTLIELLIVVVIVAILAMIAYPSYEDQVRKGRRSAAQNLLSDIATRQQQYMLDARQYAVGAGALGALSVTVPTDVAPFYTVTIDPAAPTLPPSFTLVATPVPGSRQVPDGVLTLDSAGAKTRNGQPGWK
jgi:type IV pilus assembly protein PilE